MGVPVVKFNRQGQTEFYKELNRRTNQYFKENNLSKYANLNMKLKTVFMLSLYFIPLTFILTGVVTTLWPVMAMWALMGLGMSGIGLSIMHDANHGSYSTNPRVNKVMGFTINLLGGNHITWRIQHNVLHHTYTNVHGFDEDLEQGVMRFSPNQPRKKMYRFQAFYAPFFYALLSLYKFLVKDFIQLVRYNKNELLAGQGLTFRSALTQALFIKAGYMLLTLVLPLIVLALPWWQILSGFLLMQFICGMILALIFQPAHVIEETDFYAVDENGSVENNWAIHEMRTTANFANNSVFFSWFVGGLNYQIEHHMFPHICHVHYKAISGIVKQTAAEFDVPYHQHRTFFGALRSHFSMLHRLGTGQYDLALAKAGS
ncbi:MAG: acyl-CoA desaturase [Bacteroidetes bacterium]|nr:MAG: acyl-CoA desaturase [Bacteroidota bacterium]